MTACQSEKVCAERLSKKAGKRVPRSSEATCTDTRLAVLIGLIDFTLLRDVETKILSKHETRLRIESWKSAEDRRMLLERAATAR
jgi:hypothetical protein